MMQCLLEATTSYNMPDLYCSENFTIYITYMALVTGIGDLIDNTSKICNTVG